MALKRITVLLLVMLVGMTVSAQELTETFTTSDGSLTFSYPAGFQVQEMMPGVAGVADADETVAVFMFNGLMFSDFDLTGTIDPLELFTSIGLSSEEIGEPEPITLNIGSGTLTSVVMEDIGNGLVAIIETEAGPLIGLIAERSGEVSAENRELGLAILDTVVLSEPVVVTPEAPETDECAIPVADMPEGIVQFCGGVELTLPEGWFASSGYETVTNFAGIQTEDFSVSATIGVDEVTEYYNPETYFTDVVSYLAEAAGHEDYDPAEHVVTLVDDDTRTIQVYDPTQYVELEEGAVAQVVGVVTLNRDLFVIVTFTWVPSSVEMDVQPIIDQVLQSVTLNDTYTGEPAYIVVDGEMVFVYDLTWTDSTYLFAFSEQTSYIVNCPAEGVDLSSGTVWGTDIYTDDSAVCVAAVHAGAITTDGGVIRVTMLEGQESYTGSERNGVTTQDYDSWGGSFSVEPFTQPE